MSFRSQQDLWRASDPGLVPGGGGNVQLDHGLGQDSASGHWDDGLYCSEVVPGGHGQRANWEISV
jgi:hypothetical protein